MHRFAIVVALLLAACSKKGGASAEATRVFSNPSAAKLADVVAAGDSAGVTKLVAAGGDPNAVGDGGMSELQWALSNRSKNGFAALLDAGADTSHVDANGDTVMHDAAGGDDSAYLDMLIAHHVDVNIANPVTGATPLIAALMGEGHVQFHKLLAAGAKPNAADHMGNTALHVAIQINEGGEALELLNAGADPLTRNKQGKTFQAYLFVTPNHLLTDEARHGRDGVIDWLRQHNVPLEGAVPP